MKRPVIYVRMSPEEHTLIGRAAAAEGYGLTNWARQELRRKTGLPEAPEKKFREGRYGDQGGKGVVFIRADEELHAAVFAAAEERGLVPAHWARDVLLSAAKRKLSRHAK